MNKKGFTLVELLAVIVVLAIIMIIAIPSILGTMRDAQKGTFKIYAEKVLNKAQERYQSDIMLNNEDYKLDNRYYCYELEDGLGMTSTGNYRGYVYVDLADHLKPVFRIMLSDNNYSVANFTYEQLQNTDDYEKPYEFENPCELAS